MGFQLDESYNTVPERIIEFREKYPEGRLRPANPDKPYSFEVIGGKAVVVVVAAAYRDENDTMPGIGMALEPFPGTTPYTKDSELQNAETAAWGRAMVAALAVDTKKGIASAEDVRNRTAEQLPPDLTIDLMPYVRERLTKEQWAKCKKQWKEENEYPFSVFGVPPAREQEVKAFIEDFAQMTDAEELYLFRHAPEEVVDRHVAEQLAEQDVLTMDESIDAVTGEFVRGLALDESLARTKATAIFEVAGYSEREHLGHPELEVVLLMAEKAIADEIKNHPQRGEENHE